MVRPNKKKRFEYKKGKKKTTCGQYTNLAYGASHENFKPKHSVRH